VLKKIYLIAKDQSALTLIYRVKNLQICLVLSVSDSVFCCTESTIRWRRCRNSADRFSLGHSEDFRSRKTFSFSADNQSIERCMLEKLLVDFDAVFPLLSAVCEYSRHYRYLCVSSSKWHVWFASDCRGRHLSLWQMIAASCPTALGTLCSQLTFRLAWCCEHSAKIKQCDITQ